MGNTFLKQQKKDIAATSFHQKQHISKLLKYENKEFGLLMYYLKFEYIKSIDNLAGLAIGQRDINPNIQSLTIRGLEAQKYDNDLRNPFQLLMGNFDLCFVIIYLFPLLIIGLSYNLYSEEIENGTWALLKIQSKSITNYLLQKIAILYLFILIVLFSVFILAALWLRISFNVTYLCFILNNTLYVTSWFAISLLVISFNKSSAANAIMLISIWLLMTLLMPAAVNNYVSQKFTVPESLSTMLKQRDGYHKKWDIPKDVTMQLFFKEYPQYKYYKWKGDGFDWFWYYAMQHLGDVNAFETKKLFLQKLRKREDLSKQIGYFLPSLYSLQLNTSMAQTSLQHHLQFIDSTEVFHQKLRYYYYPKIFTAISVNDEDWTKITPQFCNFSREHVMLRSLYPGVFVLLFSLIAICRFKYFIK